MRRAPAYCIRMRTEGDWSRESLIRKTHPQARDNCYLIAVKHIYIDHGDRMV